MTGRIYLQDRHAPLARHAAIVLDLGQHLFVFEDTRYFGRLTLDLATLARLGPEPLSPRFTTARFVHALQRSRLSIKVKLLDQTLVAGLGNIYASEALFLARIHPLLPASKLSLEQATRLRRSIRAVLTTAIRWGSTLMLDWTGTGPRDGLFYYGRPANAPSFYEERLRVYDRAGEPCRRCRTPIRRITQAQRSTYYCPVCQPAQSNSFRCLRRSSNLEASPKSETNSNLK
jgi:formamidopyrimidine-DNA glycosylase